MEVLKSTFLFVFCLVLWIMNVAEATGQEITTFHCGACCVAVEITASLHGDFVNAFSLLPSLYLFNFISPLHSILPSSLPLLGRGGSHQYLWLCCRRPTQHLLEGRAINGIQGRAAKGQQAGEYGPMLGFLQSILHYWVSISRGETLSQPHWTWMNLKFQLLQRRKKWFSLN